LYPFGMVMPGRSYPDSYRYSINGQEKTLEIAPNTTTAEYWQYDARIGRRWNIDPRPSVAISVYAAFNNSPVYNTDPLGDTTLPTPSGANMDVGDMQFDTFDGSARKVGAVNIQPMSGSLKSFTITGECVANGSARFVAMFDKGSGKFTGYAWDKDLSYSWGDFLNDARADLANQLANSGNPFYEHYNSHSDAFWSGARLGTDVLLPSTYIKPLTIATNIEKVIPKGFANSKQFAEVGSELKAALEKAGIKFRRIGVRGSSVTNISSKGGAFRETAIGNLKASDIDVFVEFSKQSGLKANSAGFVHPDKLFKQFPELKEWSEKWGEILGRDITPGGWNPGALKDPNVIKF